MFVLIYTLFLILSGVLMVVMGFVRGYRGKLARVVTVIAGAAYAGYGIYLLLFFQGGEVRIFFYAFILPVLLLARFIRDRNASKDAQRHQAAQAAYGQPGQAPYGQPPAPGQPAAYDQPGYGLPRDPGQQPPRR